MKAVEERNPLAGEPAEFTRPAASRFAGEMSGFGRKIEIVTIPGEQS